MYKNAKGMKKSLFILIGVLTSLTVFSQENIYVDSVTNLKYQYYLDANDNNALPSATEPFDSKSLLFPT